MKVRKYKSDNYINIVCICNKEPDRETLRRTSTVNAPKSKLSVTALRFPIEAFKNLR